MAEQTLDSVLTKVINSNEPITNIATHSYEFYKRAFRFGDPLTMRLFALLVLNGHGKAKEPMINYDPELQVTQNNKRTAFRTALGLIFNNNKEQVMSLLAKGRPASYIYARDYEYNKAPELPRLHHIHCELQSGFLQMTAVFGHCSFFPMLPYEILGVKTIGFYMAKTLKTKGPKINWYFQSIHNKQKLSKAQLESLMTVSDDKDVFTKLPTQSEVYELLRLEGIIRNQLPRLLPIPNSPLGEEGTKFLNDLHKFWCK